MEELKIKNAVTIFKFESELGSDDYYTVLATCEQKQSFDGEVWEQAKREVKIIDRDVVRANESAYVALLNVLQSNGFNLLKERNGEHSIH